MECAIRFNLSSTIIVLFKFQKNNPKIKKVQNLENGAFDEKSVQNKKDVEFDFISDMFHKISCIINHIIFIIESGFPKNSKYLLNGESDQKSARNKRDAEFNFLYEVCYQI